MSVQVEFHGGKAAFGVTPTGEDEDVSTTKQCRTLELDADLWYALLFLDIQPDLKITPEFCAKTQLLLRELLRLAIDPAGATEENVFALRILFQQGQALVAGEKYVPLVSSLNFGAPPGKRYKKYEMPWWKACLLFSFAFGVILNSLHMIAGYGKIDAAYTTWSGITKTISDLSNFGWETLKSPRGVFNMENIKWTADNPRTVVERAMNMFSPFDTLGITNHNLALTLAGAAACQLKYLEDDCPYQVCKAFSFVLRAAYVDIEELGEFAAPPDKCENGNCIQYDEKTEEATVTRTSERMNVTTAKYKRITLGMIVQAQFKLETAKIVTLDGVPSGDLLELTKHFSRKIHERKLERFTAHSLSILQILNFCSLAYMASEFLAWGTGLRQLEDVEKPPSEEEKKKRALQDVVRTLELYKPESSLLHEKQRALREFKAFLEVNGSVNGITTKDVTVPGTKKVATVKITELLNRIKPDA